MKTAVVMQRQFNGVVIRQNSKSGFFNLNDLFSCYIKANPNGAKRIDKYLGLNQTKEFAETIREAELEKANNLNTPKTGDLLLPIVEPPKVIETKRGKNGGTWIHPYLFLDFAMWLNPKFKLWAMSVIEDKLIELRNEAGNRFKEMNQALKISGAVSPREYAKEATMINRIVFDGKTKDQRNNARENELDFLNKIQKYNAHLIEKGLSFSLREKECLNFRKFYEFIK